MPQAAFTGLPFSFGALRFAAVELTEGIIFRNFVDNLPPDPIPDLPWKVHAATAIFFNPRPQFEKSLPLRHAAALFWRWRRCQYDALFKLYATSQSPVNLKA
jgi:hypothetical protein